MTIATQIGKLTMTKILTALHCLLDHLLEKKGKTNDPQAEQTSKPPRRCLFPTQSPDPSHKPQAVRTKQQEELAPNTQGPSIFKSSQSPPESLKRCMSQAATRQELS